MILLENNQSETDEMEYIDSLKISRPENPTHENHIGWDAKNQNFDFSQLSKELKRVFKKAGIRKKDLKDTNTALLIADAILNQPLPDAKKKNKKVPDKNIKDIEGLTSEIGTPVLTMTRRSSTMSAQMKLLQLPSSVIFLVFGGLIIFRLIIVMPGKIHSKVICLQWIRNIICQNKMRFH